MKTTKQKRLPRKNSEQGLIRFINSEDEKLTLRAIKAVLKNPTSEGEFNTAVKRLNALRNSKDDRIALDAALVKVPDIAWWLRGLDVEDD